MRRITEEYNMVLVKEVNGKLIPAGLLGFNCPADIEQRIEREATRVTGNDNAVFNGEDYGAEEGDYEDTLMEEIQMSLEEDSDDGYVSKARLKEYADAICSNKRSLGIARMDKASRLVRDARKLVADYKLTQKIAEVILARQGDCLKEKAPGKYKSLTLQWVATQIEGASEATIARFIDSMRFQIGGKLVHVSDLFSSGKDEKGAMVMALEEFMRENPSAGAPKAKLHLNALGHDISQRSVGNLMAGIRGPGYRQAKQRHFHSPPGA